ncbi:MAG TPA: glycosyl hydrolase-related protein [Gemmatimonadaceae bacterium]|nr:glycosyl hydrolase-related protein [Gemmatimonadaceae bacterium]
MDASNPHTIVVVSHTHWDREWYHPLGVMRQRLATLVDTLLDEPDGLPFLLDGQAIVLDDYRQVRPERTQALHAALSSGALEAGPWYVLADMLLPSGEALVRNLLEGVRTVHEAWGEAPPVLYSPDAFGHAAAGPVLAAGFGLRVAVVWRGFGGPSHPPQAVVRWTHQSGAEVLLHHLPPDGYETGSSLPAHAAAAVTRWRAMRDVLLRDNPLAVTLLTNGADHHARQPSRPSAIEALRAAAAPHEVVHDSLAGFATRMATAAAGTELPSVRGELRDSAGWTWSLQGTFATRAHQKRTNALVERLLVRDTEPWTALAWFAKGVAQTTLRTAWKTLLTTHPHDTLCGCSVDDVAAAADVRWRDARAQGEAIRDDALRAIVGCDAAVQREFMARWRPMLVLRNPSARVRGGAVRLRLVDAAVADPVGPGSASRSGARVAAPLSPHAWTGEEKLQLLARTRQFDRVESPLHYPNNAVVRCSEMMAWIPPMNGHAVEPVWLAELGDVVQPVPIQQRVRGSETELHGPAWRVQRVEQGVVATHAATGARIQPLGWLSSVTDAGDTYTPSLRGAPIRAQWNALRLLARGPLHAEWELAASLDRQRAAVASAIEPSSRELPARDVVTVTATASLAMVAGTDWLTVTIRGENPAGGHRLRWVLPLPDGVHRDRVVADAAFGAVQREAGDPDETRWGAESRLPTAPLHRWLHLTGETYGLGIISDGLAEYELSSDGTLAITLVRAVGELSRRDLPERPGHAGWPLATPSAQSLGPFEARFAIVVLPQDTDAARDLLEAVADDVLSPIVGDTWRGVGTPLESCPGLTLEGEGLAFSAAKRSEDGEWLVLRCINLRATPVRGTWHLPRDAAQVYQSRLDETPGAPLTGTGPRIRFVAAPYDIVTLLVK